MRPPTWSESHVHALEQSLRCVDAGLDAFRRGQVPLLQGPDVALGEVHVVLDTGEQDTNRETRPQP